MVVTLRNNLSLFLNESRMAQPLVPDPQNIRLAMLGMVQGNGHPYSWSAIINGRYDAKMMQACGYPVISQYLDAQPREALGIAGVEVTHIWCDQRADAEKVARATFIEHVVDDASDVLGKVDAVIIATDRGHEHVERARPFIEAGVPVFIDKPLTDNEVDLLTFDQWWREQRPILSTSAMRYADAFTALPGQYGRIGAPKLIVATMAKSWERYGIHALESVYGLLPTGGWLDVVNTGTADRNVVHLRHADGVDALLMVGEALTGAFGHVRVIGPQGAIEASFDNTFQAFKAQLVAMVQWLQTGVSPAPPAQSLEQMKIIIAGIRSREHNGQRVSLSEIKP